LIRLEVEIMNINQYKDYLFSHGTTMGQVKRNQSDVLMNSTFTIDPAYKKVYILTKDGWKWEDAKYQTHSAQSISKDPVDYYLQFRPKVHYPIGSYIIVPDDTSPDINLSEDELINPFTQPTKNRTQWWIIVGRDEANAFVRYMILKCDWELRWVYGGKLQTCWACSKLASSYTSGVWVSDLSASLDDLTSIWLPDVRYTYADKVESLGMCDTRTIMHGQRFFMSNNTLDPKIYEVTKIKDINPQGIIKLSIKQDELNEKRDNIELRACDYYNDEGDIQIDKPIVETPDNTKSSTITRMLRNDDGELEEDFTQDKLQIGQAYFFVADFYNGEDIVEIDAQWRIELVNKDDFNEEEISRLTTLMKITKIDSSTIAIQPAKSSALKGLEFNLAVTDIDGEYESDPMVLEVAE